MKFKSCLYLKNSKQFVLILLCLVIFQNAFSQVCSDTAKKIDYSATGYNFSLQQHSISDDIIYLAGRFQNNLSNDRGVFAFKISPEGNPVFSKKINMDVKANEKNCSGFLYLKNGNNLLVSGQIAATGAADTAFKVIMLDNTGNLIWAKSYFDLNYGLMAVKTIRETEDSNIILMLNFYGSDGADYKAALIKINSSGDLIWANYYTLPEDNAIIGLSLSLSGNNIYIAGTTRDNRNFFMGYPDFEHNFFAAKISQSTGELIDSKSFLNLRTQYSYYGQSIWGDIYANLIKTNSGGFVFTNLFEDSRHTLHGLQKIQMDSNLNFSNAIFYNYNNVGRYQRIIANEKGEVITYAENLSGTDLKGTFVSKFNSSNEPIREIQIKYSIGSNFQGVGRMPIGLKDKYISLINTYNVAGDTHFQLFQMPDDVEMSDCYGTDTSVVTQKPYPVTEVNHPFLTVTKSISMQVKDVEAVVSDLPLVTASDCVIKSVCDSLSVSGQDTICNINTPYTFVAHKNRDCNKHVFWQIDSSAIQFKEQVSDTTIQIQFKKNWSGYLYASINSCSVLKDSIKINVLSSPGAIDLGRDTSLCTSDELLLNAKRGFKNYVWQDGSLDSVLTVTKPGKYFVTAWDYCNNFYSDTIQITYHQPSAINIGNDTSICSNEPLLLNAGNGFNKYEWSTAATTQSIQADHVGNYSVSATNEYGCISRDTIKIRNVFPAPEIMLDKKNTLCIGQNNTINTGSGFATYLWQNGITDSSIAVTVPGLYKVIVSNDFNCFATDSVDILKVVTPPSNFLDADSSICSGDKIKIYPRGIFNEYLWNTGSSSSSIEIDQPGIYWLTVQDKNLCTGSDTIHILKKDCNAVFYIPNAFTPNDDGLNDIFKPIVTGKISDFYFAVYNRFGKMIFSTNNPGAGWDGKINGTPQNSGIFVWQCRYKTKNEAPEFKKGMVTLVR